MGIPNLVRWGLPKKYKSSIIVNLEAINILYMHTKKDSTEISEILTKKLLCGSILGVFLPYIIIQILNFIVGFIAIFFVIKLMFNRR